MQIQNVQSAVAEPISSAAGEPANFADSSMSKALAGGLKTLQIALSS
jgi:hypothetical protein